MRIILWLIILLETSNCLTQSLYVPDVDNSSYSGKAMFGYQGWFAHPDDQSPRPDYWHWGNLDVIGSGPLEVEMYPDLREYCQTEKYNTVYTLPNGNVAPVFSSGNKQTVQRHMKWVRDYDMDGVFLQRFISEYGDPVVMEFRDSVTTAVMTGCENYGRVFSIMYDGVWDAVDEIKADWMHLVDNIGILDSDRYLHHNGKPLVSLWGFTFYPDATVNQLEELIDWFQSGAAPQYQASIKLGLNDSWFLLDQNWQNTFERVDVISPWSVGRFNNQASYDFYVQNQVVPGKAWCDSMNILFAPVLFPGFSWYNLMDANAPQNEIPRDGGNFFWMQAYGAMQLNTEAMYFAMLDELDEATAFFKTSENNSQSPAQEYWLNLDEDGYDLPSDWYLRCASKATQILRNEISNTAVLGTPPEGIMAVRILEDICGLQFIFPDFVNSGTIDISLDGGMSYTYSTSDDVGVYEITNLLTESADIVVRYPQNQGVSMGQVCLPSDCLISSQVNLSLADECITIFPNPTSDELYIQIGNLEYNINVIDSQGNNIQSYLTNEDIIIDISSLPAGLHFIELVNNTHSLVYLKKILKQ